jgi:hypothetical protein
VYTLYILRPISKSISVRYFCRSAELSDSDINEQLEKSLKKITRVISVPENEKLEEENKFLLTRLSSVVEQLSLGSTNGASVAMESGHHRDSDSSVSLSLSALLTLTLWMPWVSS